MLRVFVFVDAIDENEVSDSVKDMLLDLTRSNKNLHVLITNTSDFNPRVNVDKLYWIESSIGTRVIDQDIGIYINSKIAESHALKSVSTSLRDDIKAEILSRANGVYVVFEIFKIVLCH